jgi:hypothetical protein
MHPKYTIQIGQSGGEKPTIKVKGCSKIQKPIKTRDFGSIGTFEGIKGLFSPQKVDLQCAVAAESRISPP